MSATTRILSTDRDNPDPAILDEAASVLRRGGLVAFATETVYGLGADATNPQAVRRIFEAKGRPSTNPLIVHADGLEMAQTCYRECPPRLESLARSWWPGPITFVWHKSGLISDLVTARHGTVGVRVPVPNVARRLVRHLGRPVAAPSANRSTEISPTRAEHVLKSLEGRIELVLDTGPTDVGLESTIVDLTSAIPRILRPGPISLADLARRTNLGFTLKAPSEHDSPSPPSPGQMLLHYAPRTPAFWVEPNELLGLQAHGRDGYLIVGPHHLVERPKDAPFIRVQGVYDASRRLYEILHNLDAMGLDAIYVVPPPDLPEWQAVRDRLWRATRPKA